MGKRYYSSRGINIHQSYSIDEVGFIIGVTPQTIRRWIKEDGLEAMTSQKPFLIQGANLKAFLDSRKKSKAKLKPGEFHCFKCRQRGQPLGSMADYIAKGPRPRLSALCGHCESPVSLLVGPDKLAAYSCFLHIVTACE